MNYPHPTWRDMKEYVNSIDNDKLDQPLRVWGEDRGFSIELLESVDEDYYHDDESAYRKSDMTDFTEEEKSNCKFLFPQGSPMMWIDEVNAVADDNKEEFGKTEIAQ